jgi:hypothetical protein
MDAGKVAWHDRHCCLKAGRADTRGNTILDVVDNRSDVVGDVLDSRVNSTLNVIGNGSNSVLDGVDNGVDSTGDTVDNGSDSRCDTILDVVDDRRNDTSDTADDVVLDVVDNRGNGILDGLHARKGTLDITDETVNVGKLTLGDSVVNRLVQSIDVTVNVLDLVDSRGNTILDAVNTSLEVTNETVDTGDLDIGDLALVQVGLERSIDVNINVLDVLSGLLA